MNLKVIKQSHLEVITYTHHSCTLLNDYTLFMSKYVETKSFTVLPKPLHTSRLQLDYKRPLLTVKMAEISYGKIHFALLNGY